MLRRLFIAVAMVALCAWRPEPAAAQDKVRITYGTEGFSYVAVFIARTMGYFEEVGLDVEILRADSGSKALTAVIGGNADVFIGSTASPLNARAKEADVVLFAALATQYSSNVTISNDWAEKHGLTKDSDYQARLAALKGITIGVTGPGSGTDQIVRYLAAEAGLDPDRDMTIVALGSEGSAMLAAFSEGRVDGFSISSPTSHVGVRDFGGMLLFNMGVGQVDALNGFFQVGAAANGEWLKENPETAVKVARAFQMALDTLRDPEETLKARDLVHEAYHSRIDEGLYEQAWAELSRMTPETVQITQDMIEDIISFNNRFSDAKQDIGLAATAFTNEYAAQAVAQN